MSDLSNTIDRIIAQGSIFKTDLSKIETQVSKLQYDCTIHDHNRTCETPSITPQEEQDIQRLIHAIEDGKVRGTSIKENYDRKIVTETQTEGKSVAKIETTVVTRKTEPVEDVLVEKSIKSKLEQLLQTKGSQVFYGKNLSLYGDHAGYLGASSAKDTVIIDNSSLFLIDYAWYATSSCFGGDNSFGCNQYPFDFSYIDTNQRAQIPFKNLLRVSLTHGYFSDTLSLSYFLSDGDVRRVELTFDKNSPDAQKIKDRLDSEIAATSVTSDL